MKIKWLGHASVAFTTNDGTKIVTDPYRTGYFERPDGWIWYRELNEEADIVLVSHKHVDHNNVEAIKGNPQVLYGSDLAENPQTCKDIEFRAIASFHDDCQGKSLGKNHLILFTLDGVKVCFTGDQGCLLSKEQIDEIGQVDLMVLSVGLLNPIGEMQYNINEAGEKVRTAHKGYILSTEMPEKLYEQVNPRMTIPIHCSNEKCSFKLASVSSFVAGRNNFRKIAASEIEVKPDDLPDNEIVILEPYM